MATDTVQCAICGERAPEPLTAECNWCDRRYHLNPRNDVPGKDCGRVWIDEQFMALQFACNDCADDGLADADAQASDALARVARPAPPAQPVPSPASPPRRRRYRKRA